MVKYQKESQNSHKETQDNHSVMHNVQKDTQANAQWPQRCKSRKDHSITHKINQQNEETDSEWCKMAAKKNKNRGQCCFLVSHYSLVVCDVCGRTCLLGCRWIKELYHTWERQQWKSRMMDLTGITRPAPAHAQNDKCFVFTFEDKQGALMRMVCVCGDSQRSLWGCDIFPAWLRLVFGVKSSFCCWWWGPGKGDFWLCTAVICGLIIARLNFPPSLCLRKHTHMHACTHTCFFLCYTFMFFFLSLHAHALPPSIFHAFSRCVSSGRIQAPVRYSQQIKAAAERRASALWTPWPLTCLRVDDGGLCTHR